MCVCVFLLLFFLEPVTAWREEEEEVQGSADAADVAAWLKKKRKQGIPAGRVSPVPVFVPKRRHLLQEENTLFTQTACAKPSPPRLPALAAATASKINHHPCIMRGRHQSRAAVAIAAAF